MADTFTLARRLKAGETVYTGWCGLPYPLLPEIIAREGFPAVTIDGQHGLWDTAAIVAGVAAVRQGGELARDRAVVSVSTDAAMRRLVGGIGVQADGQ